MFLQWLFQAKIKTIKIDYGMDPKRNTHGNVRVLTVSWIVYVSLVCRWYPPGHGDIYESFTNSGLLQKFLDEGKEFLFVSNIDNMGATVDVSILWYNFLISTYTRPSSV